MSVSASSSPAALPRSWPQEGRWISTRDPADCALLWRGAGAMAFAGAWAPSESQAAVPRYGAPRDSFLAELGPSSGPLESRSESTTSPVVSSSLGRAVEAYRRRAGLACLVLGDSRFVDGGGWIGDDGGPGQSTGIHSLVWVEEVGTVCVPWELPPVALDRITELARRRPDLSFLVGASSPGAARLRFPCPNMAVLAPLSRDDLDVAAALGHLAAYLESQDFRLEPPFRAEGVEAPPWLGAEESLWLRAWRRHQGLWRSLDIGTRWVLFELDHLGLWGRVEREVLGFLRSLQQRGFLASGDEGAEPWVSCGPSEGGRLAEERSDEAAPLVIRVGARLRAPYAAALASLLVAATVATESEMQSGMTLEGGGEPESSETVNEPRTSGDDEPRKGEDIDGQ